MSGRFKSPTAKAHHLVWFIHTHMLLNNLTRKEIQTRAGVSHTTLQKWWSGKQDPHLKMIEAVLNCLGYTIKPTPLLEDEGDTKKRPPYNPRLRPNK